jgi:O-antigen ligase
MTPSESPALQTPIGTFAHAVRQHGWWLIAAFVFAMPMGKGFEVPLALMTFGGIALMARHGRAILQQPEFRWLLLLFACIWLPLVTALPDAITFEPAASTALAYIRFPLAGMFALYALQDDAARHKLFVAITLILSFWIADALLQAAIGHDLFGYKPAGDRVTGPFAKLTMGLIAAVLAPIYFEVIRRRAARAGVGYWLALVPYTAVILLSGSRAAWGMYAAGMIGFAIYAWFTAAQRRTGPIILLLVLCAASIGTLMATYPPLQNKLHVTEGLFSGNYEEMDNATSQRLPIWQTGIKMVKDHWLNGIGARGFRYIYPQYAAPDDPFMKLNPTSGPTHPHQITLEILIETGVIGLLGFVAFLWLMLRRTWQAMRAGNRYAVPLGLSILVATLPVNAGIAFYGSILSALVWWLVALYCATLIQSKDAC